MSENKIVKPAKRIMEMSKKLQTKMQLDTAQLSGGISTDQDAWKQVLPEDLTPEIYEKTVAFRDDLTQAAIVAAGSFAKTHIELCDKAGEDAPRSKVVDLALRVGEREEINVAVSVDPEDRGEVTAEFVTNLNHAERSEDLSNLFGWVKQYVQE